MKKSVYLVSLVIVLVIAAATLIYDYFTISKSEALQISERYIAAKSFKWKVSEINSDKGDWVVQLTPIELVQEATWLHIDKHTGRINKILESE
jgi:hypothetical protein